MNADAESAGDGGGGGGGTEGMAPITDPPSSSWIKYRDDGGKAYYYNKETKASQWKLPEEYAQWKSAEFDKYIKKSSWRRYKDQDKGEYYYYEKITKKTQWRIPTELQNFERRLEDLISEKLSRKSTKSSGSIEVEGREDEEVEDEIQQETKEMVEVGVKEDAGMETIDVSLEDEKVLPITKIPQYIACHTHLQFS